MSRAISLSYKGLRALDPDLPFLATEAAVDIDNLLAKGTENSVAMQNLAELLKYSLDKLPEDERPRLFLDLATLSVIQDALRIKSQQEMENLLVERANEMAKILGDPVNNRDKLPEAREFCLILSKAAMAHRALIDETEVVYFFS